MKTSNCSQIVGQFVSSLVEDKASKKRPGSPDVSSSLKRVNLDDSHSEANKVVKRASQFMLSSHDRRKKNIELDIQRSCDKFNVKYSPPLAADTERARYSTEKE